MSRQPASEEDWPTFIQLLLPRELAMRISQPSLFSRQILSVSSSKQHPLSLLLNWSILIQLVCRVSSKKPLKGSDEKNTCLPTPNPLKTASHAHGVNSTLLTSGFPRLRALPMSLMVSFPVSLSTQCFLEYTQNIPSLRLSFFVFLVLLKFGGLVSPPPHPKT